MAYLRSVIRLGPQELATMKALAAGQPVPIPSYQRLRLEMLGLARDGLGGIQLTAAGRKFLREAPPRPFQPKLESAPAKRDALGRRRANQRVFFT
jgi:hypothetical protein